MAYQPGPLTEWPWQKLGNMKYALLAPWVAHSAYKLLVSTKEGDEIDLLNMAIFPIMLLRLLHCQLWISVARYQTARGEHRIINKSLDFDQVDRERNWDDQMIMAALWLYVGTMVIPGSSHFPWWNTRGAGLAVLLHAGPVEFIYYWLHRALHHHFLYSRYHSHHHASIVTEPITSVIHPFAEEMAYFVLFAIPLVAMGLTGTASVIAVAGYLLYIDFMNYLGHCNFEMVPKWLFDVFPPLKYLMYTPSFHSLHHTQFRTNYCLFMPFYDYVYGTMDKSSDDLYESTLIKGRKEAPDAIHLTHLTTLHSIYHLRFGLASLASKPYASKWYFWLLWPLTCVWVALTWIYGSTFIVERNRMNQLQLETWVVPRHTFQYMSLSHRKVINGMIEKAILKAEDMGAKVISLGLLNQDDELNAYGGLYIRKNPKLKIRIVDGTSLAVAVILDSINPHGTKACFLRGRISKMAYLLALSLIQRQMQVVMLRRDEYKQLKQRLPEEMHKYVVLSDVQYYASDVWLVGDGFSDEEANKAAKFTHFIPFSPFPLKKTRKDCFYHSTPAMEIPKAYENMHACENWLPRRVMSAWRIAGVVHALEGWGDHECGEITTGADKVWLAALRHGFRPLDRSHIFHA